MAVGKQGPEAPKSDPLSILNNRHLVILVHGIRDFALWQETVGRALSEAGFRVEFTNYGRFDLFRFLVPIGYFRRRAIEEVLKQIRIAKHTNSADEISIIAHSFGTYVVSHILQENFDLKFSRIIFCGSVVRYGFPFEQFYQRIEPPILNEVGTRDIWPAVAESVTWGYGSAGTYGFRRPLVKDRWHNGAGHNFFLKPEFCANFWVPHLKNGHVEEASAEPERPRLWIQLLSIVRVKYVALALGALALAPSLGVQRLDPWTWISGYVRPERSTPATELDSLSSAANSVQVVKELSEKLKIEHIRVLSRAERTKLLGSLSSVPKKWWSSDSLWRDIAIRTKSLMAVIDGTIAVGTFSWEAEQLPYWALLKENLDYRIPPGRIVAIKPFRIRVDYCAKNVCDVEFILKGYDERGKLRYLNSQVSYSHPQGVFVDTTLNSNDTLYFEPNQQLVVNKDVLFELYCRHDGKIFGGSKVEIKWSAANDVQGGYATWLSCNTDAVQASIGLGVSAAESRQFEPEVRPDPGPPT